MNKADVFNKYVSRIRYRLNSQNKNWLAIICGETGSGKSYAALSLGQKIGRVFIVFTALEFMTLINSGKLQRGDVVIFDEAGVGMSSREWYTVQNKLLGSVLQTFRNMNIGVIFTTPNLSFIDIQARKLFHNYLETSYIDFKKELVHLKAYYIQVNSRYDKVYFKHPRFTDEKGVSVCMSHLALNKPTDNLISYYERRKLEYTRQLNLNALKELRGDNKVVKVKPDEEKIAKEVLARKEEYTKVYNGRSSIDRELLSSQFNVGFDMAKRIKKRVERMMTNTKSVG